MEMEESKRFPYASTPFEARTVLLLAAHPDDEVLGAGGTLALLAAREAAVRVVIFSRGEGWGDPAVRMEESKAAAAVLGLPAPEFLEFPDRGFADRLDDLKGAIARLVLDARPDLLFCPAPSELHPDHRALARACVLLIQSLRVGDDALQALWSASIAFYEVSHPVAADRLVDITAVAAKKEEAVRCFASQIERNDFARKMMGLNAYRSYTLPKEVTHAEAFRVAPWQALQTTPLTALFPEPQEPAADLPSVGAVVRTKDRPEFLKEALQSLAAQFVPPAQVAVVNDGSVPVQEVIAGFAALNITLIGAGGIGRGAAANRGLAALTTEFAAFLDDDDVVYPHHYQRLLETAVRSRAEAVYADALSTVQAFDPVGGAYAAKDKVIAYSRDFDPDYLLYDNYIPLHTLLFRRRLLAAAGPLREDLPVFEDWEWLIRLSRLTPFLHIKELTCEYRHFSATQTLGEDPRSKPEFAEGRRRVLELTKALRTPATEERLFKELAERAGRLEREKAVLAGETAYLRRQAEEMAGERDRLHRELGLAHEGLERAARDHDELRRRDGERRGQVGQLEEELARHREEVARLDAHLQTTYDEIHRLNTTVALIYASKTWKVHSWVQKIKARWSGRP
jgi:LmbE family N-acetylglucosaminyl deacetylase/glycosyltransferase involved in cell wall biosynthesis